MAEKREKVPLSAREKALRLLEHSARSEAELRGQLRRSGFDRAAVDDAVAACCRSGFINDGLLAGDYAELLTQRGSGPRLIRQKLARRGIAQETGEAALAAVKAAEPESARRALEFKLRMLTAEKDPRKKKEKAYRFLASRGFSAEVIRKVLDEAAAAFSGAEKEDF